MATSVSRYRFALRQAAPFLISADFDLLTEELRARMILTTEEAEEVLTEKTAEYRVMKLKIVLCGKQPQTLNLLCPVLCAMNLKEASDRLLQEYDEALTAPPDVSTEAYNSVLLLGGVPSLPWDLVSREKAAIDIRDALITTSSSQRIVFIYGMGGYGKTTLLAEAIRNIEVVDHFSGGIRWFSIGPNSSVEKLFAWHDRWNRLNRIVDNEKLLIVIDDVWSDEIISAVAEKFTAARIAATSRSLSSLGEARYECSFTYKTFKGFSYDECHFIFAKRLDMTPEELPTVTIDAICSACDRWPLGVTSAAQLVLEDSVEKGWTIEECLNNYLTRMLKKEYRLLRADVIDSFDEKFDTNVDLQFALYLSISNLKPKQRARLESLAVLDPDVWLSSQALQMVWAHLGQHNEPDIALELPGILTRTSSIRLSDDAAGHQVKQPQTLYKLHDVMHAVVRNSLTGDDIDAINGQIITNYERICGGRWGMLSDDGYIITHLLDHLEQAHRSSDILNAISDFFFVSKLFAAGSWATVDQSVRRFAALFVTSEQQQFRDRLIDALEEVACAGSDPSYEVSLLQSLLQFPCDHLMFEWAEKAMRSHPEAADPFGIGFWIPAHRSRSATYSRKKRLSPMRRTRGTMTKVKDHGEIACIAVNASKDLLVAVGRDKTLTVCDAYSLMCKTSGMRLLLEGTAQQVAITNGDRTLLLLTDQLELFFAHMRSCLQDLPRDCAIDGESEEIHVLRFLPNVSVQSFALQGDWIAVMDSDFVLNVMQMTFNPRNNAPSVDMEKRSFSSKSPVSCKQKLYDTVTQIETLWTELDVEMRNVSSENEIFTSQLIPMIVHFKNLFSGARELSAEVTSEGGKCSIHKNWLRYIHTDVAYIAEGLNRKFLRLPFIPTWFKIVLCNVNQINDLLVTVMEPNIEMSTNGAFLAVRSPQNVQNVIVYEIGDVVGLTLHLRLPTAVRDVHFVQVEDAASVHLAVAYGKTIGIWGVHDRHLCLQLEHERNVQLFAFDPQLELCAVLEHPILTVWRLSHISDSKLLLTSDEHFDPLLQLSMAKLPIWVCQRGFGQLRTQIQPYLPRIQSVRVTAPAVVTVGDRMLLVTNIADEVLVIIDPHMRCVLLSDMDNKIKGRVVASWHGGIAVGGDNGALCEYCCSGDGHFFKAPLLDVRRLQFATITALEYTTRGSLVIGLENGAIWQRNESGELHRLKDADGKLVCCLFVLRKRSSFISVGADSATVDLHVWRETEESVSCESEITFSSETLHGFLSAQRNNLFAFFRDVCAPKVSSKETWVIIQTSVIDDHVIVINIENGCQFHVKCVGFRLTRAVFHPSHDHLLFVFSQSEIVCYRVDTDSQRMWRLNLSSSFCDFRFLDSDRVIITFADGVTVWHFSPEGQLSHGRLILSGAKVKGSLLTTFVSPDTLLAVSTSDEERVYNIYPLKRVAL